MLSLLCCHINAFLFKAENKTQACHAVVCVCVSPGKRIWSASITQTLMQSHKADVTGCGRGSHVHALRTTSDVPSLHLHPSPHPADLMVAISVVHVWRWFVFVCVPARRPSLHLAVRVRLLRWVLHSFVWNFSMCVCVFFFLICIAETWTSRILLVCLWQLITAARWARRPSPTAPLQLTTTTDTWVSEKKNEQKSWSNFLKCICWVVTDHVNE